MAWRPTAGRLSLQLVPGEGIEPTWCCHRRILSPLRLPVSPSRHFRLQPGGFWLWPRCALNLRCKLASAATMPSGPCCESAASTSFAIPARTRIIPETGNERQGIRGHADIMRVVQIDDFDYKLPEELIAQYPAPERTASRLLHLDATNGSIADRAFADLPGLLRNGDVLVMNDTRVFKARLLGKKASGGRIEIMLERIHGPRQALALLRASHAPGVGQKIELQDASTVTVEGREGQFFRLGFDADILQVMDRIGTVPLPPYISRNASAEDVARYQTVYAREPGAVAAPTAGLHFDQSLLERIQRIGVRIAYITLHVGSGTFQPVRTEEIEEHEMHSERYCVPGETAQAIARARAEGGRVLAVGTTSLRALESAAEDDGIRHGWAETALFVRPGYRFQVVDRLLTNFHLPRSTLLMLVSAFAGTENIRNAYSHAIERRYRFFSYGDAMLIERAAPTG